jgi:hypothetical protein
LNPVTGIPYVPGALLELTVIYSVRTNGGIPVEDGENEKVNPRRSTVIGLTIS